MGWEGEGFGSTTGGVSACVGGVCAEVVGGVEEADGVEGACTVGVLPPPPPPPHAANVSKVKMVSVRCGRFIMFLFLVNQLMIIKYADFLKSGQLYRLKLIQSSIEYYFI